ncbi:DEKNAAC102743 [Brettanomyces naardenensis]|uniref:DEKNAAC102743 n=1 Tax=Brettanomyces naardenensis TaxID=13370 RepID=A0A448YL74_BRENA|nr:DEKNAAC102743 [Brettanomyces naardenensis]
MNDVMLLDVSSDSEGKPSPSERIIEPKEIAAGSAIGEDASTVIAGSPQRHVESPAELEILTSPTPTPVHIDTTETRPTITRTTTGSNVTSATTATTRTGITPDEPLEKNIEIRNVIESDRDSDASFEAISRNIRKSFAAKTLKVKEDGDEAEKETEREEEEEAEGETEREKVIKVEREKIEVKKVRKTVETEEKTQKVHMQTVNHSMMQEYTTADEKAEAQIKEISHLIEEDSDELLLSDLGDDLGLGKLEKIELSDIRVPLKDDSGSSSKLPNVNSSTTPLAPKSPIKFAELPSREPLTVRSTRKKSIRRSRRSTVNHKHKEAEASSPTERLQKRIRKPVSTSRKSLKKPGDATSPSPFREGVKMTTPSAGSSMFRKNFRLDLPPFVYQSPVNQDSDEPTIKLNRSLKSQDALPTTTPQRKDDLLTRLMAPTASSAKKARRSSAEFGSPVKASLGGPSLQPITQKGPSKSPIKRAADKVHDERLKRIPLTEKSLKPPADSELFKKTKLSVSPSTKEMIHRKLEKRKGEQQERVKRQKIIEERIALKRLHEDNPRLNGTLFKDKAGDTSTKIKKEPVEEIPSEVNSPEREETKSLATWASSAELEKQLKRQETVNPSSIFGQVLKIDCNEIFGKKYFSNLNVNWQDSDKLGQREMDSYNRQMGWSV